MYYFYQLLRRHTQLVPHDASHSATPAFQSFVCSDNLFNASFERSSLIPTLVKSCLTFCIQVVFGRLFGRITFLRYSLTAFLAGVSGRKRMRCPSHVSLLSLIISLHGSHFVLAKSSLLVAFRCQLISRIFLSCLRWKVSMVFSSFFVSVHNSLLYKSTLATYALKVLSLILIESFLQLKMLLNVL